MSKMVINQNIEFLTLRHPKFPALKFDASDKFTMVNVYEFMTGKKFPEPGSLMEIPTLKKEGFSMVSTDNNQVKLTIRSKIQGDVEVTNGSYLIKIQIHDIKDVIVMDDFDKDLTFKTV